MRAASTDADYVPSCESLSFDNACLRDMRDEGFRRGFSEYPWHRNPIEPRLLMQ